MATCCTEVSAHISNYRSLHRIFPGCPSQTSALCLLKHDTALKNDQKVYLQAALLYSSPAGRRMVRVHNLCMLAASSVPEIFRLADLDAIFTANLRLTLPRLATVGGQTNSLPPFMENTTSFVGWAHLLRLQIHRSPLRPFESTSPRS